MYSAVTLLSIKLDLLQQFSQTSQSSGFDLKCRHFKKLHPALNCYESNSKNICSEDVNNPLSIYLQLEPVTFAFLYLLSTSEQFFCLSAPLIVIIYLLKEPKNAAFKSLNFKLFLGPPQRGACTTHQLPPLPWSPKSA